jgi:hypothetical protein
MIINMLPRPIIDTLMRFEQMHYIDSLENYVKKQVKWLIPPLSNYNQILHLNE